jgi:hypothetical protein
MGFGVINRPQSKLKLIARLWNNDVPVYTGAEFLSKKYDKTVYLKVTKVKEVS